MMPAHRRPYALVFLCAARLELTGRFLQNTTRYLYECRLLIFRMSLTGSL